MDIFSSVIERLVKSRSIQILDRGLYVVNQKDSMIHISVDHNYEKPYYLEVSNCYSWHDSISSLLDELSNIITPQAQVIH